MEIYDTNRPILITKDMMLDAIKKNEPIKLMRHKDGKRLNISHHCNMTETIVCMKEGNLKLSGFDGRDLVFNKNEIYHGFERRRSLLTNEVGKFSPVLMMFHDHDSRLTQKTTEKSVFQNFELHQCYECINFGKRRSSFYGKQTTIKGSYISSYLENLYNFPLNMRICLVETDYKNKKATCIKTWRKLPMKYMDWKEVIEQNKCNR